MYSLPALHTARISFEHRESVSLDAFTAITALARGNRANVIEGGGSIERELERIIAKYFFPDGGEKAEEFASMIVESDTCSFAAKRRLAVWIADKKGLLAGKAKSDYEKLLGDAMRARNAFAHGSLSSDGEKVWLSFFEGRPVKVELTDEYLRKTEITLSHAFHETRKLFPQHESISEEEG